MRGEECRIQANEEIEGGDTSSRDWVSQMNEELKEVPQESKRWKATSIYMIPLSLKQLHLLSKKAYEPQMVAIGPYHHDEEQLKSMEVHKKRAVFNFLKKSNKSFKFYVDALTPVVQDLKNAYDQLPAKLQTDDFLKMMIFDGCFILELMRKPDDDRNKDPVFSKHGGLYFDPHLRRDMLMLENQIPLEVLITLVDEEGLWKHKQLTDAILKFFQREEDKIDNIEIESCLHILDLYRKSLLSTKKKPCSSSRSCCDEMVVCIKKEKKQQYTIRSATELKEAGIRLVESETTILNDISFTGGCLKLPWITVDDATRSMYLNMMALERFHVEAGNEVTSYVFFMDRLIDTAKDVSLLHWSGIIENSLGSDHDVAELFNSLSTDICPDPDSVFYIVQKKVARYYRLPWSPCMAYARHTYFTNPWVSLSVVAAILIFALTTIQTVYAVLDYHK